MDQDEFNTEDTGTFKRDADWNPYSVWRKQIKDASQEDSLPDADPIPASDDTWSPYRVWEALIKRQS